MIRNSVLKLFWTPIRINVRYNICPFPFGNIVRNLPPTQCSLLQNGLIVATEERDSCNTCVGLYIDAGSRYESSSENGITHLFEHLVFKGTTSKPKTALEDIISSTGATFRCHTSREMVAYYAECLSQDINVVTEILFDCVYKNAFSSSDLEIQKKTVYQEMLHLDRFSQDYLFDYLHSTAFQGTPLGQSVMGKSTNLYNFKPESIENYIKRLYLPQRTILVTVGSVKHDQMVNFGNSCFNKVDTPAGILLGPCRYTGSEITYRDDSMHVGHVAIAVEGPRYCSSDRLVLQLAGMVIGGWDRSQPGGQNLGLRAARAATSGLSDCYQSFHFFYKDTSLWGTQFISTRNEVEDMLSVVQDEWMRLCNVVSDRELIGPKRQLKSHLLSITQSSAGACHQIAEWVMYTGRRPPLQEIFMLIDKITAKDVKDVCTRYIYNKCPAIASVGSTECLPEYNRIRAGMYWLRI